MLGILFCPGATEKWDGLVTICPKTALLRFLFLALDFQLEIQTGLISMIFSNMQGND